ncbi:xanthine permease [Pelosinus fermentans]|uniref:nucleobase:cation symporter-2 family protein n=1 Tax=Pelosinus fermentans TaxID=365349 RepID=UPI0002686092|nr:nucleobase:cation symporter-2 family protein [Pelosinus fermentans]OAM92314.1 xanthine permease [Pelosinus fermentans DSM 17108]SDQ40554.1 xanthine permease [Pelosinus fermentans]
MKNSAGKTYLLGTQHVLAMYAGAIIVPLIVGGALKLNFEQMGYIIAADLLTSGLATLLQAWRNPFSGIGLPVVLGCTFTAVFPMISIGSQYGMTAMYGSIICSGLFVVLIANYFSKLVTFFPPVVTGSVVTIIGITLVPVAINNVAGGVGSADFGSLSNFTLAFGVLLFIILLNRFTTGFIRSISVLLGLIAGTIVAAIMGNVSFSSVAQASWFNMITPFYFGMPTFEPSAIITMIVVAIVSMIESTGVFMALGEICGKKITETDLTRGYRAEGIAVILGGIFNSFPYTTFSQNVGLVQLSHSKTTNVTIVAGFMLILLGLIPKFAALAMIIPNSVLGGAMIAMFGIVVASGIKMLSKVDFASNENLLVIACSVALGLGVTVVPNLFVKFPPLLKMFFENGIVTGALTAVILNIILNMGHKKMPTKFDH